MSVVQLINLTVSDFKALVFETVTECISRQQPTASAEQYLTAKEVSTMLSVNPATLWRWGKSNYLTPIRIGGKIRYKLSDIQKLIQAEPGG